MVVTKFFNSRLPWICSNSGFWKAATCKFSLIDRQIPRQFLGWSFRTFLPLAFLSLLAVERAWASDPARSPIVSRVYSVEGNSKPLEFEVFDEQTKRFERGFGFPALSAGKLTFAEGQLQDSWGDPTQVLHFQRGAQIAFISDLDLDAELSADRGRFAPLWEEFEAMGRVGRNNPAALSSLQLILKEGEAVLLEASIREREMERAVMRTVIAPADAEIIEGTRDSVNINSHSGNLFRYFPLSHVRFQVRVPLEAWGPDWPLALSIDHRPAQILKLYSADLDTTNEEWILGIEFKPMRSLKTMNDSFAYRLNITPPVRPHLTRGLELHPPSCALVGRRRSYPLTSPKIPGVVRFSTPENTWVHLGEQVGEVELSGLDDLLRKVADYRARSGRLIAEVETRLIPSGVVSDNDPRLTRLRQYHSQAGSLLERSSVMTIEAKESGLLVGTLDYQGPLSAESSSMTAHVESPYVELLDVLISKSIDVQDDDIVVVELPSGGQRLAKVFRVVPETLGAIQDLRGVQRISVLIHSPDYLIGEDANTPFRDPLDAKNESGMPVYVRIPRYANGAERTRIQGELQAAFELAKRQPPPEGPLYPIQFSFQSSSLSALEKMAYMQLANQALDGELPKPRSYLELLTRAIIREHNPEMRWTAFRRVADLKFTSSFEAFVEIAVHGQADVASAALFHLYERRCPFELFDVLQLLQQMQSEAVHEDLEPRQVLCYQLLRGMLDYPNLQSDALTHFIKRARLESKFQERLAGLFEEVILSEGVNAPASLRILRGEGTTGHPFLLESELKSAQSRLGAEGQEYLRRAYEAELARRILLGISRNSRYGYGAAFIENGFLYLRDLEQIDALVRSRQNYLQDLRFLESSPRWIESFRLDPTVIQVFLQTRELPVPIEADALVGTRSSKFGQDIDFAAFRQLTKPERSRLIGELGASQDFITLVLLLRDPFVRHNNAGDILDWLLLTPESRFELTRYYSECVDEELLDWIDQRQFAVEVLADMDSIVRRLEQSVLQATPNHFENAVGTLTISPATIRIYQQLLIHLAERNANVSDRFLFLVTWLGLLPSAFELQEPFPSAQVLSSALGLESDHVTAGIQYVRQRRALKHAVARQRDKRAENPKVEIQPGAEEILLRRVLEQVEAGMPPGRTPLSILQDVVASYGDRQNPADDSYLALVDTLQLLRLRDQEFATGRRERIQFQDIALYVVRIVFAPLYLLAIIPLVWVIKTMLLLLSTLSFGQWASERSLKRDLRFSKRLLKAVDDGNPIKPELARWVGILESDSMKLDRLVKLQERVKRILNSRELVYHISDANVANNSGLKSGLAEYSPDSLHPEMTIKLAPCLTLLALLCRLTAGRIVEHADPQSTNGRRIYFLMDWFLQRSSYFSGYRYTLNPLTNHQIADTYIWQNIPHVDVAEYSLLVRLAVLPLNIGIGLVNLFGGIVLSLPMRFLYLFMPISFAGSALFQFSLKRLVILPGNLLEENLYPDPEGLMRKTRERLRTGWTRREASPDLPGGRFVFGFRRIATRILPFVIITTVVSGAFPYIYEILSHQRWERAWNLRSTGGYAVLTAIFVLAITMVLHWLPLLTGWIPFNHIRNRVAIRRLRRRSRRKLLPPAARRLVRSLCADDELRRMNLDNAIDALRIEQETQTPVMDILVLMVEVPDLLEQYGRLAKALVNKRTAVLTFATNESMDGGGARLSTLKTIQETYTQIRERHPNLPERFEDTRSYFMPLGKDCDPLAPLLVNLTVPAGAGVENAVPVTPFELAIANVQAFMRSSFVYQQDNLLVRFVGSMTASPQRLYVGPHNVDQGGQFRGGITLVGEFESIDSAGKRGSMVVMGEQAFIRSSTSQLRSIIQDDAELSQWLDPLNESKRQLPVAQIVIERFRTSERYARHIATCVRYIGEIHAIRNNLLEMGPQSERDVSDEEFLDNVAIHYMRHLIVPWFIAFRGGSLESYRSAVLTGNLGVRDRRRMFNQQVLELIELFQEEGQFTRRQLPKVRFVSAPTARIFHAKTAADVDMLRKSPQVLFPTLKNTPHFAAEGLDRKKSTVPTTD